MPPRHGKTTIGTFGMAGWYLGNHPDHRVIFATYAQHYAESWGSRVRNMMAEYAETLWGLRVRSDTKAKKEWSFEGYPESGMISVGIGTGVTGRGANLFIIDDPVADAEQAFSPTIRERNWDWYLSVADSRLEPNAIEVIIMTLWHPDDLGCRIIRSWQKSPLPYKIIRLPALAEDDDELGRAVGEPLWPERFGKEEFEEKKRKSRFWWDALYRQCLVAETQIETQRGPVLIADIVAGDMVATRLGYRKVLSSGITKTCKSLCSVLFDNGSAVCGTPDHPVWLDSRNTYSALASIGRSDYTLQTWASQEIRQLSLSGSTATNTFVAPATSISEDGLEEESTNTCIGIYGSSTERASPAASIFITKTETAATIDCRIWNACRLPAISGGIIVPEQIKSFWTQSVISAFRGISQKKARNFTERLARELSRGCGVLEKKDGSVVISVRVGSGLGICGRRNSVHVDAKTLAGCANGKAIAPYAGSILSAQTAEPRLVPGDAEIFSGVPVYDLVIDEAHEFYANGILVHNSPTPEGGAIFKADWFKRYVTSDPNPERRCWRILDSGKLVFQKACITFAIVDPALGRTSASDDTAITVFAYDRAGDGELLVLHCISERIPVSEVIGRIDDLVKAWGIQWVGMEANGFQMLLANSTRKEVGITVRELNPEGRSKLSRAVPAIERAAEGRISLPDELGTEEWVSEFLTQLCLDAETKIATIEGEKRIADVRAGDFVMTRRGWKRVVEQRCTNQSARVLEVTLSNGRMILATPEHPILVPGVGFLKTSQLRAGDALLRFTGAENTTLTQTAHGISPDTFHALSISEELHCTTKSIGTKSGRFPMGMSSTTLTRTRTTTQQKISSRLLQASISAITENESSLYGRLRRVKNAELSTKLRKRAGLLPALRSAETSDMGNRTTEEFTQNSAICAARFSRPPKSQPGFAADIAVVAICELPERRRVYNLEVEDCHEFVANGILVHNCEWTGQDGDRDDIVDTVSYGVHECGRYGGDMAVIESKPRPPLFTRTRSHRAGRNLFGPR